MSSSCVDYSFGLVPRDLQLNNAKVNHLLSTCQLSAAETSRIPVAALQTQASGDFSSGPIAVVWDTPVEVFPSGFQSSSTVFTIPASGLYQLNVTLVITELAGSVSADAGVFLNVNGVDVALLNYSTVAANQSVVLVGSLTNRYQVGDQIVVKVGGIFGSSANIVYVGGVNNISLSRLAIVSISSS